MEIMRSLDFDNNPPREPCRIVCNDAENNILAVDIDKRLRDVLLNSKHRDKPLLIVSVSGKTRGGKSFLLNLLIKKLQKQQLEKNRIPKTFGFKWNGGSVSVTHGLWVWPEIFWRKDSKGREVGILLVDNQGMFDGVLDDSEMTALVTIATLISSKQIYNVSTNITVDHLQHVLRFLVSGHSDLEDNLKDFDQVKANELMFLVRDWPDEVEHKFGTEGGKSFLKDKREKANVEVKQIWDIIDASFSSVTCFNLPYPGQKVTKNSYEGDLSAIEEDFLEEINRLEETLFCPAVLSSAYNEDDSPKRTGANLVDFLERINGLPTNKSDTFFSVWTDSGNERELKKALETIMNEIRNVEVEYLRDIISREMRLFKEKLKGFKIKKDACWQKLQQLVANVVNTQVIDAALIKYKDEMQPFNLENVQCYHSEIWQQIKKFIYKNKIEDNNLNLRMNSFVKKAAEIYYTECSINVEVQFTGKLATIESLQQLGGLHENYIQDNFKINPDFKEENKFIHKMHIEKIKKRTFMDFINYGFHLALKEYNIDMTKAMDDDYTFYFKDNLQTLHKEKFCSAVHSFKTYVTAENEHCTTLSRALEKALTKHKKRNSHNKKRTCHVAVTGILTAASFAVPPLLTAAIPAAFEAGAAGVVVASVSKPFRLFRM